MVTSFKKGISRALRKKGYIHKKPFFLGGEGGGRGDWRPSCTPPQIRRAWNNKIGSVIPWHILSLNGITHRVPWTNILTRYSLQCYSLDAVTRYCSKSKWTLSLVSSFVVKSLMTKICRIFKTKQHIDMKLAWET